MKNNKKKKRLTINDYVAGNEANYKIPKRYLNRLEKINSHNFDNQNLEEDVSQELPTETQNLNNNISQIEHNSDFENQKEQENLEPVLDDKQNEDELLFLDDDKLLNNNEIFDNQSDKQIIDDSHDEIDDNKPIDDKKQKLPQQQQLNEYSNKPSIIDNDVLLEVKELTKSYSRHTKPAIDKISFQVHRGEFHAFVGANGAGKTTTIKSIVGAYANFQGQIKICGIDNRNKHSRIKLGYIPEIARFPIRLSAYDYLNSMARLNGLDKLEADKFTKDILEKFNMLPLQKISPNNFSSGQKKKILLAQALSNNPDILVMDEPAANLDPRSRIEFFDVLKTLQNQGKSIFISSHILSELDIYANAITILDGGKIVYSGKRKEEQFDDNIYAFKLVLKKQNDFGNVKKSHLNIIQDKMDKTHYIVSSNDKDSINDFINQLFVKQKLLKAEVYSLSIEEMYKKYVIKGSVHTSI